MARGVKPASRTDEVAELMSRNLTTDQIAARLGMSMNGVQGYITRIRRGLGSQAV